METPDIPRAPERRSIPRTITPLTGVPAMDVGTLRFPLRQSQLDQLVRDALQEDGAFNDITTIATVVSDRRSRATLVARQNGVVCGVPLALDAFRQLDGKVSIRVDHEDGSRVKTGEPVLFVTGHARGLLSAERVALNYMQRLSGIATLTCKYVDLVKGTRAQILDTRKTTPGWRALEKYAVRAGGGTNHRMDLASGVLIKDNHLSALDGDVGKAVSRARELAPRGTQIEVECDRLDQVQRAVEAGADIILLDNMPPDVLREAVSNVAGRAILEASGGVNLSTVRAIAETGVDWISVGALTHSAPSMDLALDFE
ncbi:MAG TPA: carboxylating nicotinate-nucleotide diphosphorylase [Gemmatimonadaceae bacterium]|jgi:nicotinate-nucleotide pyrophosphorylase (carboxylating)|nr:carboxylating nicotinate-nucleotide diphosphorylase [Gemmatimonadaceae bacterium]